MRLTPLDIRKQEFKKGMRGLDADEVYAFLATVADEYEAAVSDNKALRERLLELDDKVQEYRNMEKTLRDTLLTAERVTVEAKDNARREAELIIKQAELDADKGVRDIKASATQLRQEIKTLKNQRESYLARMKMLVESYLKFIETAEQDFDEDAQLLDIGRKDENRETQTSSADPTGSSDEEHASTTTLPADQPIGETTPSTLPDTVVGTPARPPLQENFPTPRTDGTRTDTMTETDAGTRLNELLDRVVQQQTVVQTEMNSTAETATKEVQPMPAPGATTVDDLAAVLAPEAATVDDLAAARPADDARGPEKDGADSEQPEEWSLERLKYDILSRRAGQDETS
jgi:cell division initiation protein